MILPIVGYGDPVLRKVGEDITPDYTNLKETIANMYETMYNAFGVGLAAQQIGLNIRLFVIDTTPFGDDEDFNVKTEVFDGLIARVIQHEYDHNEGILFTDLISTLKRKLNKKKLQNIMDGKARPDYRMKFCNKKGR